MDNGSERIAGYNLIINGASVCFDVCNTEVEHGDEYSEAFVRIDLQMGEEEEDGDRSEDWNWGAFGFIYALAVLSFADSRPRGYSEIDYVEKDDFNVNDLFECLSYERGQLRFRADYIRGRCMKTDIDVLPDGKAVLKTRARGEAALRWIDQLRGKKVLRLVTDQDTV